jgi:hypothetical protein
LSYEELLAAVPVRNQAVQTEQRGPKELILYVPLRKRWFNSPPVTWVLPISQRRGVGLDALGAEVWKACNGRSGTLEIIRRFAEAHGLAFHEARVSVCTFLRMLTERKLIAMVGADGGEVAV